MAAFPTSTVPGYFVTPDSSRENTLEIAEDFTFTVLDSTSGHSASGKVAKLVGQRLIAQVSEYMSADTCVRIHCDDAFVLGEILGCWREGPAMFAAVQLVQAVTRLKELAELRQECWESPRLVTRLRQRA